jgi:hypothetical protein
MYSTELKYVSDVCLSEPIISRRRNTLTSAATPASRSELAFSTHLLRERFGKRVSNASRCACESQVLIVQRPVLAQEQQPSLRLHVTVSCLQTTSGGSPVGIPIHEGGAALSWKCRAVCSRMSHMEGASI